MELTEHDIRIFYELYSRFNITSPNIGIVGDSKKFNKIINEIIKQFKDKPVRVIRGINKLRILTSDNIEITYIHIQTLENLRGNYFKKFI